MRRGACFHPLKRFTWGTLRLNNLFANLGPWVPRGAGGPAPTLGTSSVDNQELLMSSGFLFLETKRELQDKSGGGGLGGEGRLFSPGLDLSHQGAREIQLGTRGRLPLSEIWQDIFKLALQRRERQRVAGKHGRRHYFTINEGKKTPWPLLRMNHSRAVNKKGRVRPLPLSKSGSASEHPHFTYLYQQKPPPCLLPSLASHQHWSPGHMVPSPTRS